MTGTWLKHLSLLFALAFVAVLSNCVGTNPAGPPAPLAEVPSAISFPESVAIDVTEVSPGGPPPDAALQALALMKEQVMPVGGEFFEAITFGFTSNQLIDAAVGGILLELSLLEIPTNPITRTLTAENAFLGTTVKIDFADFDFDGNGGTKGCTGCTCPTGCDAECPAEAPPESLRPICYRIWNDPFGSGNFVPLMAGFFERVPIRDDPDTPEDEANPGVGSFRASVESRFAEGEPPDVITNFGSNYDHLKPNRPLDKTTEYFLSLVFPFFMPPDATVSFVTVEQRALDEIPDENRLLKTIRESVNQPISGEPEDTSTFQYIARYRTDFDFWSGTFQNFLRFPDFSFAVPPTIDNFTAVCAQLSTAIGVDPGTCRDIGIDVSGIPFLELVQPTDPRVNLPADFPPTPTF